MNSRGCNPRTGVDYHATLKGSNKSRLMPITVQPLQGYRFLVTTHGFHPRLFTSNPFRIESARFQFYFGIGLLNSLT